MIYLLVVLLLLLCVFCYLFSGKKFITPEFGFCCSFFCSVFVAALYSEQWDLKLSIDTFFIIFGGVVLFVFVSFLVRGFLRRRVGAVSSDKGQITIFVERWKLVAFGIMQAALVIYLARYYLSVTSAKNLSSAIYMFYQSNFGVSELTVSSHIPTVVSMLRGMSQSAVYIWLYIIVHGLVYKEKQPWILLIINSILGLGMSLMSGSRGGTVCTVLASFVMFLVLYGAKNDWRSKVNSKSVGIIIVLVLIIVISFQKLGGLIGRNDSFVATGFDMIAIYLSGSIANLNTYIGKYGFDIQQINWMTIYNLIEGVFGWLGDDYSLVLSEYNNRFVNLRHGGNYTGNVYTCFGVYLFDAGWLGVVCYIVIMAVLSQLVYYVAANSFKKSNRIKLSVIIYAFIFVRIMLSFFSSRFYEEIFNEQFIKTLIYWWGIRFLLLNVRWKKSRK